MTMTDEVTLGHREAHPRETSESAIAMVDERGKVVAWTQVAELLLGYSAGDAVGGSASLVLPDAEEAPTISAFVERCRTQNGWPGTMAVRHRNGHMLDINLRMSKVCGYGGSVQWLLSVSDVGPLAGRAMSGSARESLLVRAPIGISVRDVQLRCTWVNDTMESHDGISRDRRLGRRFIDALPGAKPKRSRP